MSLLGGGGADEVSKKGGAAAADQLSSLMGMLGGPDMSGLGTMPHSPGGQPLDNNQKMSIMSLFAKKDPEFNPSSINWKKMGTLQGPNQGTGE